MNLCHVCGNELETLLPEAIDPQTKEKFTVLACKECNLLKTHPQPENLEKYYAEYYGGRHGFSNDYCVWRRMRFLEKSVRLEQRTKRLLDVGCGDGTFLIAAEKRGWNVCGTELNARKFADSELEIYENLDEIKKNYGDESFDAITFWHTLEHFKNPREVLENAHEILRRDGVLLIAVPDSGGFQAKIFCKYWLHLDVPRHLFHFDFKSLKLLLKQTGFEIKDHWHQEFEYDLLGWSQSGLNVIFKKNPNIFFNGLTGKETKANNFVRQLNFGLGIVFSALALPLVLFGALVKKGGTLIICAAKSKQPARTG